VSLTVTVDGVELDAEWTDDAPETRAAPLLHDRVDPGQTRERARPGAAPFAAKAGKPEAAYLETLLRYYEEEVEGEAYFAALADRLEDAEQREKIRLMAEVETYAAAAVYPLLGKYGLRPRPSVHLHRAGHAQADGAPAGWKDLIAELRESFPGYVDDFRRLEAMAPEADLPALKVLTAHELAAIAFLDAEAAGKPDSTAPMRRYLETGTA